MSGLNSATSDWTNSGTGADLSERIPEVISPWTRAAKRSRMSFTVNDVRDLFAALVQGLMISGMRSLRSAPVPEFVHSLVEEFRPLIPRPPPRQQNQFDYIRRLLEHPITDGRHRVIWLILAPYFTTVRGMDEASATDAVLSYIGDAKYKQFIRYNVRRALRSGLYPVSEQSVRTKHPDIMAVLPKGVISK
jgi:hypothetical protein